MCAAGKLRTALSGYAIHLYGPKGERDWAAALDDAILAKLDGGGRGGGCERLAFVDWTEETQVDRVSDTT